MQFVRSSSGLLFPFVPPKPVPPAPKFELGEFLHDPVTGLDTPESRAAYEQRHARCPTCGGKNYEQTCMGPIGGIDHNRARCSCGWVGIVHDMVPADSRSCDLCWTCHWGWPKPVAEIYRRALAEVDGDDMLLSYSAAHVVWGEHNFDDGCVQSCIREIDERGADFFDRTPEEFALLRRSLVDLLQVPLDVRCYVPAGYDGNAPQDCKPEAGREMVKVR